MRLALLIVGCSTTLNMVVGVLVLGYDPPWLTQILTWFLNPAGWVFGGAAGFAVNRVIKNR